jgi:Spy/CpxP family protein refolding chaperone
MKKLIVKTGWILPAIIFFLLILTVSGQKTNQHKKVMKPVTENSAVQDLKEPGTLPPVQGKVASPEGPGRPMLDLPGLTDDQREKIKKSDLKMMEQMTPMKNKMHELKAHLTTLLSISPVNMKEADDVSDEIGKLESTILKQQIRHDQEIRSFLTPDQQILFDARPKPFLEPKHPPAKRFKEEKMIREF